MILDTGESECGFMGTGRPSQRQIVSVHQPGLRGLTIGALRNQAIREALEWWQPEEEVLIAHQDSDDWSGPQRIAEQVSLLTSSGADCVGYHEAAFYDTRPGQFAGAWIYRDPARRHVLGASMCYLRSAWERHPFDDINVGEDARFAARCKTVAVSSLKVPEMHYPQVDITRGGLFGGEADTHRRFAPGPVQISEGTMPCEPRIICGIHGGNTSNGYDFSKRQQCFKRAPELDEVCRIKMAVE